MKLDIETYGCEELQVTDEEVFGYFIEGELREDEVLKYSMALLKGIGTSEDPESAARWLRGISNKDPYARYVYGMMKIRGMGVRRNRKSGIKDVQVAAKQGCVAAVITVARWLTQGIILPRDLDRAETLLDELGDYPFAYYYKALIAIEGGHSPKSLMSRALRSCMEIDYSDNPEILYLAAEICESGLSEDGANLEEALRLYRLADKAGHPTAAEEANSISESLKSKNPVERNTGIPWMDRIIEDAMVAISAIRDEDGLASRLGIKTKRAFLFTGVPGTGKTFAAKEIAKKVGAHIIYLSANELLSRYVGGEQKAINEAIKEANDYDISVIIIDECDAVMQRRDERNASYVNTLTDSMLMMVDGVRTVPMGHVCLFFAITNTPWLLDPAFLRSGRF
ncbi:MAG: AAA family ATPase, partial [Candidatus Methanomethylophilaceae archaeon]|nr:AAA family ATPase [Candidatus Methanomethylophilaceae archaeon]